MDVVDDYDDISQPSAVAPSGYVVKYYKVFADEGVKVMVKIWYSIDGLIIKLSDAIPYLLN